SVVSGGVAAAVWPLSGCKAANWRQRQHRDPALTRSSGLNCAIDTLRAGAGRGARGRGAGAGRGARGGGGGAGAGHRRAGPATQGKARASTVSGTCCAGCPARRGRDYRRYAYLLRALVLEGGVRVARDERHAAEVLGHAAVGGDRAAGEDLAARGVQALEG